MNKFLLLQAIKQSNLHPTTKSFLSSVLKNVEENDDLLDSVLNDPQASEAKRVASQQMKEIEIEDPEVEEVSPYDPSMDYPNTQEQAEQWAAYMEKLTGMPPHPNAIKRILNRNQAATKI